MTSGDSETPAVIDNKTLHLVLISANQWGKPYPVYPLGISYLASYLREKLPWLQVTLLNVNDPQFEVSSLNHIQADLIGISLRNIDDVDSINQQCFIDGYTELIKQIKTTSTSPIILGGAGFSIYQKQLLEKFEIDFGIAGEGELALKHFLQAMFAGESVDNIHGVIYRHKPQKAEQSTIRYITDPKLSFERELLPFYWNASGMLNIQTKRGCPYSCIYCTYPLIDGRKVRTFQPDQIIDTLRQAYIEHNIDYVFFTDSVFNINPNYNNQLADALIKAKLPIKWGAYFSPYNLTEDQLQHYQAAGLSHIEFGTESLANSTLRSYGKPFDVEQVYAVSESCYRLKINYAHFLIIGGVGETEKSLNETVCNAARLKNTVFFPFFGMRIYPGTKLQKIAIREKKITADDPLIIPKYYLNESLNYEAFRQSVKNSSQAWVMPDDASNYEIEARLRKKGRRGPLWEYFVLQ